MTSEQASIIEGMAKKFYAEFVTDKGIATSWSDLAPDVRVLFVEAMAETVKAVPDQCALTNGDGTATFDLSGGRDAILAEHQAKYLLPPEMHNTAPRLNNR